ncbi:glycosyltransferase family 4 protein [Mesorhizobium sp. 1B3]|uniref:glycosyltransferase family 4 protein n=1 Tax=Mesorhizobium sp. 1B3 TaxID=3243599 RepID=UPI003D9855AA
MDDRKPSFQSGLVHKIIIVSQYYKPENFVINTISERLAARGHDVKVLTGMPNYPHGRVFSGYRGFAPRRDKHDSIEVVRVPLIPRGRAKGLRLALNYLSFAVSATLAVPFLWKKADVVFVFQPSPVTVGLPALAVKWLSGIPIVFWVQDLWPESLAATGATRNQAIIGRVRSFVRFLYRRSDIIAISSRAFEEKILTLAPGSDVRYLPNPANPEPEKSSPSGPSEAGFPEGFRILFTGNFGVAQGLETVLEAAKQTRHLQHIKWILAGDGRQRAALRSRIDLDGLQDTVAMVGPFPAHAMPALLEQADALLVTLRRDPLFALTVPSKLQTYLAAGRPILAATDGETARIVEEARAGYSCPAGDAAALARAAIRLSELDAPARQAMGEAGRSYYSREFALDHIVERLENWFDELLGKRACAS